MISSDSEPDRRNESSIPESMAENPPLPSSPPGPPKGLGELESLSEKNGNGRSLAHFRLIEEVGRGGMGTIYRAMDTLLDRQVAVKVLSEELSDTPAFQERFVREAKIVARMNHPSIPQIHFIGRAEGRLFFAMEWIEGQTLEGLLAEGPVPPARALDIAMQAAEALQLAHRAGIVHRDIKPSNLMLTSEGMVKVLDFGIARSTVFQGGATMTGQFLGTPQYASPEQARGTTVDARSDIYSLGITLFQLLTGRLPFEGDNPLLVLTDRLVKPPPELPEEMERTPGIRALVARMLATQPEDRFPDGGALLDAIRTVYPTPPVPAHLSRRAMAFLTDLLLAGAPLVVVFAGFWAVKGYYITTLLYDSVLGRIILGLGLFSWLVAYSVVLGGRSGRTVGQRLQATRVTKLDGGKPSSRAMALRAAIWWGPVCLAMAIQWDWPPVLVSTPSGSEDYLFSNLPWILAQLWILLLGSAIMLNERHWSLADWLSRTQVVEKPPLGAQRGEQPVLRRGWRGGFRSSRPLLNAGVLLVWLAVAIFVGAETRYSLPPPWWSPAKVYERHTMFERVQTGDPGWDRLATRFLHEFLRTGESARNPEVLSFTRHPFLPLLFASMDSVLVVENNAYGVRLLDEAVGVWAFAGARTYIVKSRTVSEEMEPAGDDQARQWDKERRRVYRGSYEHFLRALMHQKLREEGFEVLNPEAFVGLVRTGETFILIAWPELRVRVPGEDEPKDLLLYRGWIGVNRTGIAAGSFGYWGYSNLPPSVLSAYAAEQDSVWGEATESIQQVMKLE